MGEDPIEEMTNYYPPIEKKFLPRLMSVEVLPPSRSLSLSPLLEPEIGVISKPRSLND